MAADALEKSVLESKDKDQLVAIATALGIKAGPRAKKEDIIVKILDTVGGPGASSSSSSSSSSAGESAGEPVKRGRGRPPKAKADGDDDGEADSKPAATPRPAPRSATPEVILGADGEPLAEWEAELVRKGESTVAELTGGESAPAATERTDRGDRGPRNDRGPRDNNNPRYQGQNNRNGQPGGQQGNQNGGPRNDRNDRDSFEGDGRNRRRRRRGKGGREEGPQGEDREGTTERTWNRDSGNTAQGGEFVPQETVTIEGYLDLRDEGYGFLRVKGYLPSREDAYVSVKQTRQYGLRKGDHVTGMARTAGRNEKNPALLEVLTVNGGDPEKVKNRPRFEDLTALFPDEKLKLEHPLDPGNMTARIIDLISPIGKGQRGIIVSPPKAGKTLILQNICGAKPGELDMATLGQPAKYACCFAENAENNPWPPLHVERGLAADASVVTVVGIAGTVEVNDSDSQTASDMAQTFAQSMLIAGVAGGSGLLGGGEPLCILPPEWVELFNREGLDKQKTKAAIWERACLPVDKLAPAMRTRRMAAGGDPSANIIRVADKSEDLMIVVAGGVGRKAAYAPTWGGTTKAVSREIRIRK